MTSLINPVSIFGAIILLIVVSVLIVRRKYPRAWFVFQVIVLRRKYLAEKAIKTELENSKKHKYETFEEFLQDCPEYQIDTDFLGNLIRSIKKSAGQEFQQYVFIRKNNPTDKTAFLRREGKTLIHKNGTYFKPWESEKKIIYYDLEDSRPLIDMTNEMDWKNGDMCADVVTALTNSTDMAKLDGEKSQFSNYMLILMGLSALAVILIGYDIYTNGKMNENLITILKTAATKAGITIT